MAVERFEIDPGHTVVGFSVRHLVISKVRGVFTGVKGTIAIDNEDMTRSGVEVHVATASIDTNEPDRDAHLRSADFLDVERYPEMLFVSTSVEVMDARHLQIVGDLTLHGITRELSLATTYGGRVRDPWGAERVGFEAETSFDRTDFGLNWNAALEAGGVLVGNSVDISIELEAVRATASSPVG